MAGIYVPRCELPKEGHWLIITHNGEVQYVDFTNPYIVIPDKAIPVSDHGRLGDLDELYKKMEHYSDNEGATEYQDDRFIFRDSILFAIEVAPTVIPAERQEGKT